MLNAGVDPVGMQFNGYTNNKNDSAPNFNLAGKLIKRFRHLVIAEGRVCT